MVCCHVFVARVCVTVVGLVQSSLLCSQLKQFVVEIYACAFTCACSFTVSAQCSGNLAEFQSFCVFSHPGHLLLLLLLFEDASRKGG